MEQSTVVIFWFRRDLRLQDNCGLRAALEYGLPVIPLFIFDRSILDQLESPVDHRVAFIHKCIMELSNELSNYGSTMLVFHGYPLDIFAELTQRFLIRAVFTNHDYEPAAIDRDKRVASFLLTRGIRFFSFKDQCIFERTEIVKPDGTPYIIYTPYSKAWLARLSPYDYEDRRTDHLFHRFWKSQPMPIPSLEQVGFEPIDHGVPPLDLSRRTLLHYPERRDYPALDATSHASVHLRFGTVSIRQLVRRAIELDALHWLNELIWREFFMMILSNFPHVVDRDFQPQFHFMPWRNNLEDFERWCQGQTGYPLIDAGMRQLNATGRMHNRVRMVAASFLTKHLLIDWRWGERYFASKLLDYELSSNNGNWQWAAGSGCDAAPYFRIFNPTLQLEKFDPDHIYIHTWIPELGSRDYPMPIVEHTFARNRALEAYAISMKEYMNYRK